MRTILCCALASCLWAAEKPRVYVTESQALLVSGGNELNLMGGTSPQAIEVMKNFQKHCPAVMVTNNREKADFIVRLDHEAPSPVTPFTKGNKVAVFDRNDDLIYSNSTRTLAPVVKGACQAITKRRN